MYSRSHSVHPEMPTTTAVLATRRTPTRSLQCHPPASHLHSSLSLPQHQGLVSTSRPRRRSSKWLVVVKISCPDWSTTVATNHQLPHRQCPIRTAHQHTTSAQSRSAALAPGDVAATSTSKTTAPLHWVVNSLVWAPSAPAATRQKPSLGRKRNSLACVQELGICFTRNVCFCHIRQCLLLFLSFYLPSIVIFPYLHHGVYWCSSCP